MKLLSYVRKLSFPFVAEILLALCCVLPAHAAVHPIQHSAREQINALVLTAASHEIDTLAQKQQWQDYRYTFNIYIPSAVSTSALCSSAPQITSSTSPLMALTRMNFSVSCPGSAGWQYNVAVRPDVSVPVVMPKSLIARDTVITADDLQLKKFNISNQREGLMTNMDEAIGLTSKRALQPGKPITRSELVQPVMVKRDQPVTIVSRMAGITASMPGVALKNGRKGDVIKIRNSSSQRIVSGVVDDVGVVTTLTAEQ
ncbi:flagellar basal body P-ring formation chaperone FlgA [Citrobacter sp. HN-141]|uniref:flagellar basal body P-ring formation chaperone FlgA n=1 Tax=unclassified Citrobacter TaxID=2644389 RepID=UPI002964B6CE|nr:MULTISPECIES: flagellar basal body P-ring formation chaperone FlgA [unclassified Citrobacter]MDW2642574.1 flagellar basal body P-ring formation chaperone FlgA [Citrobacter sp. HN-141]MDW2652173.1 flagellar basal body P-ring formation chaperone FlgA [Citrobacter sp. HN-120]MDW2695198.1 flagellar basal body P-ring formation chaperone FlgA [Citrobacter sp. HN-144]